MRVLAPELESTVTMPPEGHGIEPSALSFTAWTIWLVGAVCMNQAPIAPPGVVTIRQNEFWRLESAVRARPPSPHCRLPEPSSFCAYTAHSDWAVLLSV